MLNSAVKIYSEDISSGNADERERHTKAVPGLSTLALG